MKPLLSFLVLLISATAWSQQSGMNLKVDSLNLNKYDFSQSETWLDFQQPEIRLSQDFYSILQVPNERERYTKGHVLMKRPEFIPEMPMVPVDPFADFYLLDLDPVIITPTKEE